ncbi:hypothetical protein D9Q98_005927 [Chlorella vulgaris]|uniref:Histone deacetylase domain-containing protein n=1 Tax=Chlorella vulgaris TaxID=3077 RepID=A0A9D4TWI4_CHLVU|nr:hypothetical protein D9Q98_005927 [Chlorella vulgaris]
MRAAHSGNTGVAAAAQSSGAVLLPPASLTAARLLYATAGAAGHDSPGHPECAARVPAILEALETHGLTARSSGVLELTGFSAAPRPAVQLVHAAGYVAGLERASATSAERERAIDLDGSTYCTASTSSDACLAAGAAIALVDNVVAASRLSADPSAVPAGFAVCRPPGHHCLANEPMGFCLLGNVAIAARHAQTQHGLQRVMIFDWDVHHGNGTQAIFEHDPDVLFISSHQAGIYPSTGKASEVGTGDGEGATINLPLPGDSGHEAMLAAFDEVVAPAAQRFQPDILLVSAGYDAHWRDPLAGLQCRSSTFHALGHRAKLLADELPSCRGRLVMLLEGGYDLKALGESVANTFLGVLGEAAADNFNPALLRDEPMDKVQQVLREARRVHGL